MKLSFPDQLMVKKTSIFVCFLLLCSSLAFAQTLSLRLKNPRVRLSIPPGGKEIGKIKVENPTAVEVSVKAYLEDWVYDASATGPKLFSAPGTSTFSGSWWISFSPAEFRIPPFGFQEISYTVDVPADARGGYYAALLLETAVGELRNQKEGVKLLMAARLPALFYIEAEGTIERTAEIKNISLLKEKDYLVLEADFTNQGNVQLKTSGDFYIMNQAGIVLSRGQFNDIYTLPQDKVHIQTKIPALAPGSYFLVLNFDLGEYAKVLEGSLEVNNDGKINLQIKDEQE